MARLLVFDGFVFVSAFVFFGYLLGLNTFLSKQGENGCDMTYMYEYPQFVRISFPPNVTAEYRRYGLYAYSEGRQTQQVRNMQFSGIPVLFIPGQGGSLKQVRSLASVSLRKSLGSELQFHFDYFTLDLNEEYSAMFGGVLQDQTRFTVYAVQRILSLYRRVRPDSIVLVGHSMGGMIAKGLFLEPDFPAYAVRLVVTLATPHSPVLLTDPLLRDYYQRVTPHWSTRGENVTVISLGGGVKDLVVRSGLTLTEKADISALTTAVSEVWMSVDHLCILWCKQLVLVLVRSLFDCVDQHTLQISRDPQHRLSVFKYHLLERSAGKRFHESTHPAELTLQTQRAEWLELSRPRWSDTRSSLHTPVHVLVHLPPAHVSAATAEDTLAVVVGGHKARDWLFACAQLSTVEGRRVCTAGENLSSLGRIAPSKHRKNKVALVSLRDLRVRGLSYVVIRLPPSDEPTTVSYDMFSARERSVVVSLPRWFIPFQGTTLIDSTTRDSVFYTLDLPQLERPWQAYQLHLVTVKCASVANISHQAVATLRVPWSHQHYSVVLRNNPATVLPVLLHTARPSDWTGPAPYVTLYLDPQCQYSVLLESSLVDTLAQVVRLYSSQLVAYVAAILLLTLRQQLISLGTNEHCLLFHHALLEGAKPYYVLPAVKIASTVLSQVPEPFKSLLPSGDLGSLQQSGLDFLLLPLILYAVAFSLTFLLGLLAYVGVVCSGSTINKFALKFVGKLAGVSRTWTDWLMAAVDKVPCVVSVAMIAILLSSCGGLAMVIGAVYYFMRVCGMYEDYIEQLFFAPVKYLKDTVLARFKGQPQTRIVDDMIREAEDLLSLKGLTEFNFHLTLLLLWCTATMVHIPSVLVWAHNFKVLSLKRVTEFNFHLTLLLLWCTATMVHIPSVLVWAHNFKVLSLKRLTEFNFHLTLLLLWCTATMVHIPSVLVWAHNFKVLSLKRLTEFNFHLTLLLLWCTATMVHIPSVLVWAHNFKYNPVLDPDPATAAALVSSVCVAFLWTLNTPVCSESSGEMYKNMSNVMFVLAILVLAYCPISLYNLPTLTSVVLVCLMLHQLYEWASLRFRRESEPSLVSLSETTPATDDSEEDQSKPAIKDSPDSEDETPTESEGSRKNSRTSEISMSSYDAVSLTELKAAEREKLEDEESVEEGEEGEEEENEEVDDEEEENDEEVENEQESEKDEDNEYQGRFEKDDRYEREDQLNEKQNSKKEKLPEEQNKKKEQLPKEQNKKKEQSPKEQYKKNEQLLKGKTDQKEQINKEETDEIGQTDKDRDVKDLPKLKRKQRKEENEDSE